VLQSRGCSIVDAGQEKYPKLCHGTLQQACRHVSMYPCLVRCRRQEAGERWREISMEIAQSTAGTAESGGVLSRLCGRFGRFYTGVSASSIELGQDWKRGPVIQQSLSSSVAIVILLTIAQALASSAQHCSHRSKTQACIHSTLCSPPPRPRRRSWYGDLSRITQGRFRETGPKPDKSSVRHPDGAKEESSR
jgi:hypothetical protein